MHELRNKDGNIFDQIPQNIPLEIFETLFKSDKILIERIVSAGHITRDNQWYDQEKDEWVILIQGNSTLEFEHGNNLELKSGDYFFIPRKTKHRVIFTSTSPPCIWLALHANISSEK